MSDQIKRQPKGIPTGGEFAANAHDEAPTGLTGETTYESPSVATTLVLEHYDDHSDEATVIGEEEVDLRTVLDGYDLDDLPEEPQDDGDLDQFFWDAERLGLIKEHGGAFSVRIDGDEYQEYIASRRAAGQESAISRIPLHSPASYDRIVGGALDRAFPRGGLISVANWQDGADAKAWAVSARDSIKLNLDGVIESQDISEDDAEIIRSVNAVADASDEVARTPQYLNSVQRIALLMGDRLISRGRESTPF